MDPVRSIPRPLSSSEFFAHCDERINDWLILATKKSSPLPVKRLNKTRKDSPGRGSPTRGSPKTIKPVKKRNTNSPLRISESSPNQNGGMNSRSASLDNRVDRVDAPLNRDLIGLNLETKNQVSDSWASWFCALWYLVWSSAHRVGHVNAVSKYYWYCKRCPNTGQIYWRRLKDSFQCYGRPVRDMAQRSKCY